MIIAVAAGHVAASVLIGCLILSIVRWIKVRASTAGTIVALGILFRAVVGLTLFVISYADLPFARSMHSADGFWRLAPDAREYYRAATEVGSWGFGPILEPSAGYVRTLAVWMNIVGNSPAAGLYLNLLIFALSAMLIVAVWPSGNRLSELPLHASLASLTFSPVLVVHSSQPLKDDLAAGALVLGCVGSYVLFRVVRMGSALSEPLAISLGIAAMMISIWVTLAVRPYYAFLFGGAYLLAAVISGFSSDRRTAVLVNGTASVLLCTSVLASSTYSRAAISELFGSATSFSSVTTTAVEILRRHQTHFATTPGGTNAAADVMDRSLTPGAATHGRWNITSGLALMFVPTAIAQPLSIFQLSGGRSLLPFADADTVFFDATILVFIALSVRRRSSLLSNAPYLCFVSSLDLMTTLLLAYIVTNLGALLRLRLMVAVPMWMAFGALLPAKAATVSSIGEVASPSDDRDQRRVCAG